LKYLREATAAVLIPAVLAVLIVAPLWAWAALVALAGALALWEFLGLMRAGGWVVPRTASLAFFLALLGAAYLESAALLVTLAVAALLVLPSLVMFAAPKDPVWLPSLATAVFATLYAAAGAGSIVVLRSFSWKAVVFLLAIVWVGDSAAYYVGRRWGKRKLSPVVSPKKSWEGFWGQLAGGALAGAVAALLMGASVPLLIGLGVVLSVVAVIGDLVESTFKRSVAVKDSGGLLPGHGGLLDRLDSLMFAGPALLAVVRLFPEALPR
jgi:phosphatidate cytidylyltransferase